MIGGMETPAPTLPRLQRRLTLSLALQGGGAHGAFTWGVLDACSTSLCCNSTVSA